MSSELATVGPKASDQLATFLGIEKSMMLETLKAQCFPGKRPDEVSDTQLAAFVSTANVLQVNPLIPGMLYAYPSKNGGVVPILGPDGTFKKLDEHIEAGKLEGFECVVFPEDVTQKPTHATATIYRKGAKAATYTALYSEWVVSGSPVWGSKPRHMLWTRAIKQAARQVIHGLPMDAEEYQMSEMANVTPEAERPAAPERPAPPKREAKGAAKVRETVRPEVVVPTEAPASVTVAEPAPEPKVETFAQAAAATEPAPEVAKPEPTPEPPKQAAQRAFLTDGEVIDVVCKVKDVMPFNAKIGDTVTPSVQANVAGGYFGTVFAIGAATADGDKLTAKEPWVVGREVKLKLRGKHSAKLNKVQVVVDSAEAVVEEF
jgi:hypothetical protein